MPSTSAPSTARPRAQPRGTHGQHRDRHPPSCACPCTSMHCCRALPCPAQTLWVQLRRVGHPVKEGPRSKRYKQQCQLRLSTDPRMPAVRRPASHDKRSGDAEAMGVVEEGAGRALPVHQSRAPPSATRRSPRLGTRAWRWLLASPAPSLLLSRGAGFRQGVRGKRTCLPAHPSLHGLASSWPPPLAGDGPVGAGHLAGALHVG